MVCNQNFVFVCVALLISFGCLLDNVQAVQRFCGNSLTQALSLICTDGYKQKIHKRKGNDFDYDTLANDIFTLDTSGYSQPSSDGNDSESSSVVPTAPAPATFASSPFLSSLYNGMMLIQAHRRQQRGSIGAYDECCRKPCSVAEMYAYCREP